MLIANTKGRVSTLAVDDDLDMHGRNVTNVDVVSVNEHVTLVGARFPGKGFRHVERDGWSMSKDNGDVERKFWKDDFSVDSSSQYTSDVADFTWDTANSKISFTQPSTSSKYLILDKILKFGNKFHCVVSNTGRGKNGKNMYVRFLKIDDSNYYEVLVGSDNYVRLSKMLDGVKKDMISSLVAYQDGELLSITVDFDALKFTVNSNTQDITDYVAGELPNEGQFVLVAGSNGIPETFDLYEYSYPPSISYADDFATDTTERYQAVTGTVAYDDTNKRMNVTTATGANGKASGRLKSYKFCEGSQIYDVTLPTGEDGDFICLVTHSANGLMTDGIGVGLQSDGAGNWNLATLSGTTVTVGASSGLTDGKTARIEIEKDITGAYWYYIYDAAGPKPTTATGKLFTTLSEGYTGWYANGNNKTYAIENISIRAESIVGRTNVEVTEPFWFRDDFGEDSRGRYNGRPLSYTHDDSINALSFALNTLKAYPLYTEDVFSEVTAEYRFKYSTLSTSSCINLRWCSEGDLDTTHGGTLRTSGTGYSFQYRLNGATRGMVYVINGVATEIMELPTYQFEQGIIYKLKLVSSNGVHSIYLAPDNEPYGDPFISFEDNRLTQGKVIFARSGAGDPVEDVFELHSIEISGTRVYQKPIHRGAMLETYHDGTQEVVGTTFIDDCQWDRSAEYTVIRGTLTHDAINGCLKLSNASYGGTFEMYGCAAEIKGLQMSGGFIHLDFANSTGLVEGIVFGWDGQLNSSDYYFPLNGIQYFRRSNNRWRLIEITNGTTTTLISKDVDTSLFRGVNIIWDNQAGKVYLWHDGEAPLKYEVTNPNLIKPYSKVGLTTYTTTSDTAVKFYNVQIIAASPDATNGIAACIPPIGGGARYGVEEEVYFDIDNEVRYSESVVLATVKTLNPANEGVEMFFGNTTDSSKITTDDTDVEAISLEDTNYKDVVKDIVLNYDDRGDEIKVGVRKTGDNVATVYVETLAVVPKVEVV